MIAGIYVINVILDFSFRVCYHAFNGITVTTHRQEITMEAQIETAGKEAFGDMAEALAVNADQILASIGLVDGFVTVVWTPDPEGKPPFIGGLLTEDADGILRLVSVPVPVPSLDTLGEEIETAVEGRLGDGA